MSETTATTQWCCKLVQISLNTASNHHRHRQAKRTTQPPYFGFVCIYELGWVVQLLDGVRGRAAVAIKVRKYLMCMCRWVAEELLNITAKQKNGE